MAHAGDRAGRETNEPHRGDAILLPMSSPKDDVLAANGAFYAALAADDLDAMDRLWARGAPVACIHPGWDALLGRDAVMASWRAIFARGAPPIRCADATPLVFGDAAVVLCHELLPGARLVATNMFVRENGAWRIVHHQAGAVAQQSDQEPEADPEPGKLN